MSTELEGDGFRVRRATEADVGFMAGLAVHDGDRGRGRAGRRHGLRRGHRRSRIAYLHAVMLDPAYRGRGLATAATALLVRHLVFDLDYHRLQLEVYGFIERAVRHFERAGFRREGVRRRAYWRHGAWVDGILFGSSARTSSRMYARGVIIGDGTEWTREDGASQTLVFEDGRIAGFGGVNRYAGEYRLAGEELAFGPLAVTRMAGTPEAMESERHYLDALGRVARLALEEEALVLADREGIELLRFAQSAPKEETPTMELIHTCYRITDPERSVAFYEALGFEERRRMPIRDEAINIFMGLPGDGDRLELTYNFGVEEYELGTGYGHVAVTVNDIHATLARLAEQGIDPEKPPYTVREGGSLLCFVRDPDGYRIELIERA